MLLPGAVLSGAAAAAAADEEEFVPVNSLPQAEQLPAAPLLIAAYAFVWVALWLRVVALAADAKLERDLADLQRRLQKRRGVPMGEMGAGHFIYIPAMILIGVVIGWILGSRAAGTLRRRTAPPGRSRGTGGSEGGQAQAPPA